MAFSLLGCDLPGVGLGLFAVFAMVGGFRIVMDGTFGDGVSIKIETDV